MHFKGRISAPSRKVLLFSPLSSRLRRLRSPWQHQKTSHPCVRALGCRASCCRARERPDSYHPLPVLGATASLLDCPPGWAGGGGPAVGQQAQL